MYFTPENAEKYSCESCYFKCSKQSDWDRHRTTRKHKILTNCKMLGKNADRTYDCVCGKKYRHMPSLSQHKKKCVFVSTECEESSYDNTVTKIYEKKQNKSLERMTETTDFSMDNASLTKMFLESVRENREFQKQMFELMRDNMGNMGNTTNNINTNSNNTMNNQFNLNLFLNETCKDAMDIDEFIDYVKVKTDDFENFGKVGYPRAVGDIIVRNLNELDVKIRPIHCSDLKREVLYIKHDGVWHNDEDRQFMKRSIMYVANKNIKQIPKWQALNPESKNCFTKSFDKYNKLCRASLGAATDDEEADFLKKITSIVAKEVVIDKKKKY